MSRDAAVLVTIVLALLALGLIMLYSATAVVAENSARYGNDTHFLMRQLVWIVMGLGAMWATSRIPHEFWERWRVPILVATVILLALVFVPGVGARLNGARRWVRAGGFFFQPSEAAKFGVAIFLCGFAAAEPERIRKFFKGFVPAFAVLGGCCAMIVVEPDIGTTLFIATVMSLTLFVAGVRWGHILPMFLLAVAGIGYYGLTHTEHVMERLKLTWLNPELDPLGKGLQILQSLAALEGGQLWGMGLGRGTSKLYFLPEAHSDFIFAVIGEELGFVGACVVVLLYAGLGWTGYRVMRRAPDRFSFLLAFAITTYIILQAAINVAVVTKAVPTKGIPLPLVSAGGSSALFTLAALGILVRIANAAEERGLCSTKAHSASCSPAEAPAATSSPASPSPSTP
ncbi:MAG TPA: putative lipid II flippase FtsW [Planctomycetota bacterium]